MFMSNKERIPKNGSIPRLMKYIKPYTAGLVTSLILTFAAVALTLFVPRLVGNAIDLIIGKGQVDFKGIARILLIIGSAVAVTALCQWLIGVINNRMTYGIVCRMRREAFAKLQELPVSYTDTNGYGVTLSRIIADVDTFSDGLLMGFTQLFTGVLTIIGTLIFMLVIDFKIALIVVVLTPASMLVSKFIASRTFRLFRAQAEAREELTAITDETISSEKTVKAFNAQERMTDKFDSANEKLSKCSVDATFYSSIVNPATRFLNGVIYALVALAGAISSMGGGITVGGVTCFLGYANQYTKPFNEISGVITEFQNALACAARIFELIDTPSEKDAYDRNDNIKTKSDSQRYGQVDIENVSFSYDKDRSLIENFNLHVKPGQKTAIVGPTGCGKTTLINLLMRFYDIDGGSIKIDGVDIRDMTRHELRKNYGMVLQETWIKEGTVAENIALGKKDADRDEIEAAARAVHADSFIKRLPDGYDTVIGEESGNLSQGQRQLISIARVMLCMPPILILDEATSSIDIRTEAMIQEAFDKLTQGRTSFVVAHRLTTVKNADIIIMMKDGHILETGKHEELLERGGAYAELYNSQFLHSES